MAIRNGGGGRNDELFGELYRKYYWRMVLYFVRAFRMPEEDAKELAQDAFIRFYRGMKEYRGEAEWAYFETIARNVAFNQIRSRNTAMRNAPLVALDDPDANAEAIASPEPDYVEQRTLAERVKRLQQAIQSLPEGQRDCVRLRLADNSYKAIAEVVGISVDAVKSRLRDAKRELTTRLGDDNLPKEFEDDHES